MKQQNKENIKQFFEGWKLYSTIIKHNYMMHNEIIDFLIKRLKLLHKTDLRILEVGCGDAYAVSQTAEHISISHYTGIELSEMALEFAAKNLENKITSIDLVNGDMTEKVETVDGQYDVIIAGYSMHHLDYQQKSKLFAEFKEKLTSDGLLIIYDLVQQQNETADEYIERALQNFETHWLKLDAAQFASVREHVSNNDIPESWRSWRALAQENGYTHQQLHYRDKHDIYGIMEFR